ncbi:MAG: hypothetical protein ACM3PO_09175, partial [Betaproteobacteria bacterium]
TTLIVLDYCFITFIPTKVCVKTANTPLGVKFDDLIPELQEFLDRCFVPVWGTPAKLVRSRETRPKLWNMIFLDDADSPGAEGYHDITWRGMPLAKVFVKPTLAAKDLVSVTACHELCEMLIDRMATLWCEGPLARFGPTRCATPSRKRHSRSTALP